MEDIRPCRLSVWNVTSQTYLSGEEGLSLFSPEEVQGLGLPLLPLVDPPQAQDVEQDGQHHHQDAEREQVVVVDEGGAQPAGVALSQCFLLQVPGDDKKGSRRHEQTRWHMLHKKTLIFTNEHNDSNSSLYVSFNIKTIHLSHTVNIFSVMLNSKTLAYTNLHVLRFIGV